MEKDGRRSKTLDEIREDVEKKGLTKSNKEALKSQLKEKRNQIIKK